MAETLVSPGVLASEIDQSFITQGPVTAGAAIIGPTVKGPIEIPTVVTSWNNYQNIFGTTFISGGSPYTYFTSIAAYNYFNNGGQSLLVARVVSGSYTPATSSIFKSGSTTVPSFVLTTISEGDSQNSFSTPNSSGVLPSGSKDNIRWQITNVNSSSGYFNLIIRRGDDNNTDQIVLEQYNKLSLDPFDANFISKKIGDQTQTLVTTDGYYLQTSGSYRGASNYVRVSSITTLTPNYLNSNGTITDSAYSASLPLVGTSGSFGGAVGTIKGGSHFYDLIDNTDSQGLVADNYDNMINLLANKDDYQFNVLLTPGLCADLTNHGDRINDIIDVCQNRGDAIYVTDLVSYGMTTTDVVQAAANKNTSYAATYWPWVRVVDPNSG